MGSMYSFYKSYEMNRNIVPNLPVKLQVIINRGIGPKYSWKASSSFITGPEKEHINFALGELGYVHDYEMVKFLSDHYDYFLTNIVKGCNGTNTYQFSK